MCYYISGCFRRGYKGGSVHTSYMSILAMMSDMMRPSQLYAYFITYSQQQAFISRFLYPLECASTHIGLYPPPGAAHLASCVPLRFYACYHQRLKFALGIACE